METSLSFKEAIDVSRTLWDMSFPNEGDFTDFYFNRRCTDEVMLCLHKTDAIYDSAFQLFPYRANLNGMSTRMLYMSGVSTRPDMRGKGRMELCMREHLEALACGDASLVMLIPANEKLFDYYRRFGFVEVSARQTVECHVDALCTDCDGLYVEDVLSVSAVPELRHRIYEIFRRKWEAMPNSILHTEQDFQSVLDAYASDHLHLLTVCRHGEKLEEATAVALYSERASEIFVHDLVAVHPCCTENMLLACLQGRIAAEAARTKQDVKPLRMFSYSGKPFMMARILNASKAVTLYVEAYGGGDSGIRLTDNWLECNSGYYAVSLGTVRKTVTPIAGVQYVSMTAEELTARLFPVASLHASLMLDY